ncbi:nonribosomal peptide synthetase DhbF [Thermoflexales bacterium]|nr:nonribosomal peptide synthetase DhbF [Thermoflexales bacterium]
MTLIAHKPSLGTDIEFATLVEILRWRALHQPEQRAYTFLIDGETEEVHLTYRELDQLARRIGAQLQTRVAPGERALLLYPPGLEYIAAFFGCLYAGVIAVPAYPPHPSRLERTFPRLRAITQDAQPTLALTTSAILPMAEALFNMVEDAQSLRWLSTDDDDQAWAETWKPPVLDTNTLAFLQYTSGSTATPRGVTLTHGNLLHNLTLIHHGFEASTATRGVIWLPPYHDMGLIGGILEPLHGGFPVTLLSPIAFLQSPFRWLQAISRNQATISGGPNFAYDLCVRKISPEQRATLDLSSWELAFNGAEPINLRTLDQFAATFAPCGFRPEAFYPCYGLAEATLIVSGGKKDRLPNVQHFYGTALENNQVHNVAAAQENTRPLVGCGQSLLDQTIEIVNPTTLVKCASEEVGEIWVSGPSIAQGYWNRPAETHTTFQAYLADSGLGPFLRTGDLGFLKDDELFVTGRLKDLIIIRGRNHYPQDIELTVEQSYPQLRSGCGAAFSMEVGGEERLVVVQEVERHFRDTSLDDAIQAIRRAVAEQHEVQVYGVVLIRIGSIPKTSSGKIQRHACKADFLEGKLEIIGSSLLETASSSTDELYLVREALLIAAPETMPPLLESYLREQVASTLGLNPSMLDLHQPLSTFGLDSLMAIELQHRLETDLGALCPMESFLQEPSIAQLAAELLPQLTTQEAVAQIVPAPAPVSSELPLSYGQRALWFLHQLAPHSAAYNIASAVRIHSGLDIPALHRAFQKLVDRHPALRTTFAAHSLEPVQQIHDQEAVHFQEVDASEWSEKLLNAYLVEEAQRPFDLTQGPLFRVYRLTRPAGESVLLLAVHHIIADFWSMAVLMQELGQLYSAEQSGKPANLTPLALSYTDYGHWQAETLTGPTGDRLWTYWQQQLSGAPTVLDLPTDRPRPTIQSFRGAAQAFTLNQELTRQLKQIAQAEGATLYMTLLAAFQVLLYRYTHQEDILVGSPAAGRNRAQLAELVGYFVNPLVLRATLSGDLRFKDFLGQVRHTVLAALEHQDYPFPLLVERLQPMRDASRSPLFQVMFALEKAYGRSQSGVPLFVQGQAGARLDLGGLELESLPLEQQAVQFDLMLMMEEAGESLSASLQYNTDLFEATTIARMIDVFQVLLKNIVAQPEHRIGSLPLLPEDQYRQGVMAWNNTQAPYPQALCLHHLFEAQVERTPQATALIFEDQRLTYRDLNQRANQLAHRLQRLGVGPEVLVGICMERSVNLVVGLLAVLKAGGAYVPLDPAYPQERLALMLDDTQVTVLLTQSSMMGQMPQGKAQVLCLDTDGQAIAAESQANPSGNADATNLAYVLYTSGSTGRPKGVAITQRSVVAMIAWAQTIFSLEDLTGVLASTSVCFDLSVFELFVPLSWGGTVILAQNLLQLPALPAAQEVTLINTVPSVMAELLRLGQLLASVRVVNLAGEPLPGQLVQQLYQQETVQRVYNLYGPSEDTTYSTAALIGREDEATPSIGRPIANTQAYVLNAWLQPMPWGTPGELYLGGDGLARGYLNRPNLTAERFIPNPFAQEGRIGSRLYKTGDWVCYLQDGRLKYLQRADQQVKLRGFRIELREIEMVLTQHPAVREAAVLAREDQPGDKRLVAYVVPGEELHLKQNGQTSAVQQAFIHELRQYLKQKLPDYMVPSTWMLLEIMPLTPNGKLDRRALPVSDQTRPLLEQAFVAPRTLLEERLAGIWADVLRVDRVGVYDNFFELGGHSLLATQVVSRVREAFGVEPPLHTLFEGPTVAQLAQLLDQNPATPDRTKAPLIRARQRNNTDPQQVLSEIELLSESEAQQLLQQKKRERGL